MQMAAAGAIRVCSFPKPAALLTNYIYMHEHPGQPERLTDEDKVRIGVEAAQLEDRLIDDATARRLAMLHHGGQASALYSLGSTGSIDYELLTPELIATYKDQPDDEAKQTFYELIRYATYKQDRQAQRGWHLLTHDESPVICWLEGGDAP